MSKRLSGRGAIDNETGRFHRFKMELDPAEPVDGEDEPASRTQFFKDTAHTIITENDSPDLPFRYSMNFYRGCEHGCAYCYARPTHEYLGLSAGLDFESKIFIKENAPELLRKKLMSPHWEPDCVHISGVTDCYQPIERRLELTRKCLHVFAEFRNPVSLITKNHLITRDVDILSALAKDDLAIAFLSVTTLDADLARRLEPRTSTPSARLRAVETLAQAGVPVGVNVSPVIPGLTDHEMPKILEAAKNAGADFAGFTPLRLPHSVSLIFSDWLAEHRPLAKEKVLNQIRDIRDGKLNDSDFKTRMKGTGPKADTMRKMFKLFTNRLGLNQRVFKLRTDVFRRPGDQLELL